ncbi:MAG: hypothetical protein Q8P50_03370 [Bacillota bacterium]|nr:hypothetical protein [Bacillota bacterium]
MADRGFEHTVASDINALHNILEDYESGFPVLKELLQNAADAGATEIDIGWTRGIPATGHPLLNGPVLFAANNGRFTESNEHALKTIGLSDKPGQASAIGKFGLGLKSVFHVGEAFFYLGPDDGESGPGAPASPRWGCVNPWSPVKGSNEPALHEDWDQLTDTIPLSLAECLRRVLREDQPRNPARGWFSLWVPLRRESHCGRTGGITAFYPGDLPDPVAGLLHPPPLNEIMAILPMLLSLEVVRIWSTDETGAFSLEAKLTLEKSAERRQWKPGEDPPAARVWPLQGRVLGKTQGSQGGFASVFAGQEVYERREALDGYMSDSHWPKRAIIDPAQGGLMQLPEKAGPHAAASFSRLPLAGSQGKLRVSWAVFLPVGKPEPALDCSTPFDVSLLLHGYFFVDPGRNHLDFKWRGEDDERQDDKRRRDDNAVARLRVDWNRTLRDELLLPQVLPALKRFVETARLDDGETRSVTLALEKSSLIKEDELRERLCAEYQWLCRVGPSGVRWGLAERNVPVLEIPPASPEVYRSVFPGLDALETATCITFGGEPRLAARRPSAWREEQLLAVLDVPPGAFRDWPCLEYLARFLEARETDLKRSASAQDALWSASRRAVRMFGPAALRPGRDVLARVLAHVPAHRLFPVDVLSRHVSVADEVFQELAQLELQTLPLSNEFLPASDPLSPSDQAAGEMALADAVEVLRLLASPREGWTGDAFESFRNELAIVVIKAVTEERPRLLETCADLRLFCGFDAAKGRGTVLTYREIAAAKEGGCLFNEGQAIAAKLQQSLHDARILVVPRDSLKVLFPDGDRLSPCNSPACVRTLGLLPPLSPLPGERAALVEMLAPSIPQNAADRAAWLRALRYLLHRSREHADGDERLILQDEDQSSQAWVKLAREALSLENGEWRLVPTALSRLLSEQQQTWLGVQRIDKALANELIYEAEPENVSCDALTDVESDEVLLALDDDVLLRLPLHRDIHDVRRSIASPALIFLEGNFPLQDPLTQRVVVIARRSHPTVALKQQQLMKHSWNAEEAIDVVLQTNQPHLYDASIVQALQLLGETTLPDELSGRLRRTEWLVTGDGTPVAPEYVLHVPELEDEIAHIAAQHPGVVFDVGSLREEYRQPDVLHLLVKHALPPPEVALALVGQVLAENPDQLVGPLPPVEVGQHFESFIAAFQNAPNDVMPCASLLRTVAEKLSREVCVRTLLPQLLKEFPADQVVERLSHILNHLASEHTRVPAESRNDVLSLYRMYLGVADSSGELARLLPRIQLLGESKRGESGKWRPAAQLCLSAEQGVDRSHTLSRRLESIVAPKAPRIDPAQEVPQAEDRSTADTLAAQGDQRYLGPQEMAQELAETANRLKAYFQEWEGACPPGAIGAFLSLLGGGPGVEQIANHYLDQASLIASGGSGVRQRLDWEPTPQGEDILQVMPKYQFVVQIVDLGQDGLVSVHNLLGETVQLPADTDFHNLLIGKPWDKADPLWGFRLRLRKVDTQQHGERLSALIKETTRLVLQDVYQQVPPNFEKVWEELEKTGQLSLKVAQELILGHLAFYLRQLGVHHDEKLGPLVQRWDEARYRKEEARQASVGRRPDAERKADEELHDVLDEFRDLVTNDTAVQSTLLLAVQKKIGDQSRYRPQSVPFELFQNGDDAAVELLEMDERARGREDIQRFTLAWGSGRLRIAHCGRLINQFSPAPFDGRQRGYHRDLEKMLVLSASDKSDEAGVAAVTGKFGLGFKSVFLVSASPVVLSGPMAFRVVGGLYPDAVQGDAFTGLQGVAEDELGIKDPRFVTLFDLPLLANGASDEENVVREFHESLPYLLVFARTIRVCSLIPPNGRRVEAV